MKCILYIIMFTIFVAFEHTKPLYDRFLYVKQLQL